jgi:hypothetical protein
MITTAGPFLRYGNCLPGSSTWTGSVLYLTRENSSTTISATTSPLLPTETTRTPSFYQGLPPPVLIIHDPGPAQSSFTEQAQNPRQLSLSSILPTKTGSDPISASPDLLNNNGNSKSHNFPMSLKDFQRLDKKSEINEHRVAGELLDTINGWSFWRFDMELKLDSQQRLVKYVVGVSGGPSASVTGEKGTNPNYKIEEKNDDERCFGFWLPARGEPYHWGYNSCNGFDSCTL